MVDKWLQNRQFGRWLYPPTCALCGDAGMTGLDLCAGCRRDLPRNVLACPRCALALPEPCTVAVCCAHCQQQPPPYDHAWSAFPYSGALPWLHRRLKFGARLSNSRLLGTLLCDALVAAIADGQLARPDCIVVMPLHARRLMWRGFNQSLELIRPAARQLGLGLDYRSLTRLRATLPQSDLPAALRRRNVRGAFACRRDLSGLRVVLFDDVVTTGETVAEAARCLRRSGAEAVGVWSLVRTAQPTR